MLYCAPRALLRATLRSPRPPTLPLSPPHLTRLARPFHASPPSRAAPALSANLDHYSILGLHKNATRKEIKERFYDLSRKHHPDSPSTSSETPEQRTSYFQQLSQSYSVLSDPMQRKSYDLSRSGSGVPPHRRRPHHPGYTSASGGQGYAGSSSGGGAGGVGSENDDRRQRANYAWQHPRKGTSAGETAAGAAWARSDPFASRRGTGAAGQAADHFDVYAQRAKWGREREAAAAAAAANRAGRVGEGDGHYRAGTSVFGAAKAEEESRLINDSSATRSGQVALMFASVFILAMLFGRKKDDKRQGSSSGRRV